MSRVYFSTRSGAEAELRGWEKAYCFGVVEDVFNGLLGEDIWSDSKPLWRLIPDGETKRSMAERKRPLSEWFSIYRRESLTLDGEEVQPFHLILNTAWAVGSEPLQLMALLYAQCEIHGYMEGEDRAWIASLIRQGRADGLMRPNSGWEEVADLLEAADDEPVVTHYSVTDSFPTFRLTHPFEAYSEVEDTLEYKDWEAMTHDERWDRSMASLRKAPGELRWQEAGWADRWFGTGSKRLTVFDFKRNAMEIEERMPGTSYGRIYTGHEV